MANRNDTARGVAGRSESDMTKRSSHDTREEQELRRFDPRFNESMSRSWCASSASSIMRSYLADGSITAARSAQ